MKKFETIILYVTIAAVILIYITHNTEMKAFQITAAAARIWLVFIAVFLVLLLISVHIFNRGLRKLKNKDFKGAVRSFTTAARLYPWFSLAYCNRWPETKSFAFSRPSPEGTGTRKTRAAASCSARELLSLRLPWGI